MLSPGAAAAQPVAGTEKAWIDSVAETASGEIWLGTRTQGVLALDVNKGLIRNLRYDQKRPSSLADDTIFALHRDRAGLIWIGSYRGLSRHDSTPAAILPLFGDSQRPNGISDRDVRSVHAMADGRVLLGFGAAGGVDLFDPVKGRLAAIRPDPNHPDKALPADVVPSEAEASDGTLYIGTFRGLYRMDRDGRRITRMKIEGRNEDAGVQCLFLDERGLWVGGREDGVWRVDPSTGAVRERLRGDRLTDERIRVIAAGHAGEIWIATVKGINRLDPATGSVERVLPDPQDPKALAAEFTDSLLTDREGRLWVATARGVDILEGRDTQQRPRFRHIGTAQGLPHYIVYMLLEDAKGDIWASTETGLAVIGAKSFAVRALVKAEGVSFSGGFWSSSGDKTAEGDLLFGALGGLAVIRPDKVAAWRYAPPVVVTDIRIGGKPVVSGAAPLTIQPQDNSLAVEFSALDYSAPERNRYGYWLEGFDKGWIETDWTRRLASYTNLPPGDYMLHLRGSNRDGLWSETALALPIHVVPSWYQTLWFRMAAILAALFAIAMLVRSRTAYLRHRQAVLETQVLDRTRALQEKSAQVTNLLDNSGQGFLSMGADLIVGPQYSAACEIMLEGSPAGRPADQILFADDPRKADLFRHTVPRLLSERDSYKQSLLLSFLPDRIEAGELILQAAYKRLDDSHLMAVLTDITEERRLAERVEREHLRLGMIVAAVTDHRNFYGAVEAFRSFALKEIPALLAGSAPLDALREISRQIHTFKGLLSQLNFAEAPPALHRLEDRLEAIQEGGAVPSLAAIRTALEARPVAVMIEPDLDVLREALGDDFLSHGQGAAPTVRVSLRGALSDYDKVIAQAAAKTGKRVTPLVIEGGEDVWIDSGAYEPFLRSLVHVFRNAVVHGIQESGTVTCRIEALASMFRLVIADDGAGLDFDALRRKAIEMGLYSEAEAASLTERELADLIFRDRLSTRDSADEFAGRGIGLAAVRAEAHALGGAVTVESMRGEGTRFIFDLPRR